MPEPDVNVERRPWTKGTIPKDDVALDELLTVEDVATLLRVSKNWVYEHTRSRDTPRAERLPHVKIGKYVRFETQAIRTFIQRKCRTT